MNDFDPEEICLKVGLEIHQQLNTNTKLFCSCEKFDEDHFQYKARRLLRPTASELGEIDPAARFEFEKGLPIVYLMGRYSSCLVEADEEPPHQLNMDAVRTSLVIALALGSHPVDEFHVMRKIVIDGSNTTGFQRTLIIALGGELKVGNSSIPVQSVSLEEDAARLMSGFEGVREYGLDRLCVPLVEIALAPIVVEPKAVQEVSLTLGRLLRSTRLVSRGIGTIRQDINISILGGEVVEIKGVQKLELIEKVVLFEALRQLSLIKIKKELATRGLSPTDFHSKPTDVSDLFRKTGSSLLHNELKNGHRILAIQLKGFSGLIGQEFYPNIRFASELADVARFYGLGGIIHSDELPGYGISQNELDNIINNLYLDKFDGFLLIAGEANKLDQALKAVIQRVRAAFRGVISETRGPNPDGHTRFLRPRPGAARMYPETDIPPLPLEKGTIDMLKQKVPRPWDDQILEYCVKYSLSRKLATQLYDSPYFELFEEVVCNTDIPCGFIAATLTETLVSLSRSGLDISRLNEDSLRVLFKALNEGKFSKEAFPNILELLLKGEVSNVKEAVEILGLSVINEDELKSLVKQVLINNKGVIEVKRSGAFSALMGSVMSIVRGRADGKKVSNILKTELDKMLSNEIK